MLIGTKCFSGESDATKENIEMHSNYLPEHEFNEDTVPYEGVLAVLTMAIAAFAAVYISIVAAFIIIFCVLAAFGVGLLLEQFHKSDIQPSQRA
jgi:hypothetical protein